MIVVLDANIIINNYQLANADFSTLELAAKRLGIRVYVPSSVLEEVIRNHAIDLRKTWNQAKESVGRLTYLTDGLLSCADIPMRWNDDWVATYSASLRSKLAVMGAVVVDYPTTPHHKIMQRLVKRHKPFKESGEGYADALLWETVLKLARDNPEPLPIYLISNNTKDFGEGKPKQLASTLADEIVGIGQTRNRVSLVASLDIFISKYLRPRLEPLQGLINQLNAGDHYLSDTLQSLDPNTLPDLLPLLAVEAENELGGVFEGEISVYYVDPNVLGLRFLDAQQVDENHVRVEFQGTLEVTLDGYINSINAWDIDESVSDIEIWDRHWNDWYAWAAANRNVDVRFSAIINTESTTLEVVSVKSIDGFQAA